MEKKAVNFMQEEELLQIRVSLNKSSNFPVIFANKDIVGIQF